MMKRLLNCTSKELLSYNGDELKQAILASEGRTVLTETCLVPYPLMGDITNAEMAAAFGSDLILLNLFDCDNPVIPGLDTDTNTIERLKELVGRPIGCNLEPVDLNAKMLEDRQNICKGRQATKDTYQKAEKLGFNFICLTGNPGVGVSNKSICEAIKVAKENFSGMIIAGKMHGAGVDEPIVDMNSIKEFIEAGADVILMPAVNTVPGLSEETVTKACEYIHSKGCVALSAIGTSQEGSDQETIREMGIINKRCGIDVQHIGDAGYCGMALPENIMALSVAIRGVRHTYHRIASSINR
ncbi:MAG: haloacid dehalogenase-like hydrolase [Thomasclavelia sp.]|nr:haloacid dehalogenase-like hydrolase [Thomasclavelia sp.]